MAKKKPSEAVEERGVHTASTAEPKRASKRAEARVPVVARSSALVDTRVIYCGDNLEQLKKLA